MEEPMRVAITTKPSRVALLNVIELKTLIPVITFYNVCTGCQKKSVTHQIKWYDQLR
jgi:hypothetical protein